MRRSVRPGGHLVIGDGFLSRAERATWPGYEYYRSREETLRKLTAYATLVREVTIPAEELAAVNRQTTSQIRARAEDLTRRHPELADRLTGLVESEEAECEFLERETVEAIWLLRRD